MPEKSRRDAEKIFIEYKGKRFEDTGGKSHAQLLKDNNLTWKDIDGAGIIFSEGSEEYYEMMEPDNGFVYYLRKKLKKEKM